MKISEENHGNLQGNATKFQGNLTRNEGFIMGKTLRNRSLELSNPNFFTVNHDFSEKKKAFTENLKVFPAILLETRKGNLEFLHKRKEGLMLKYKIVKKPPILY